MGITVAITRRAEPFDEDGPAITREEWLAVTAADPEMNEPSDENEDTWLWSSGVGDVTFEWTDGQIEAVNPDQRTVAKMKLLAAQLSANVFSETGEIYDASGQSAGFLAGYP